MARKAGQSMDAKLGPEFRARLRQAKADQRITAIAVLETVPTDRPPARRRSRSERKALAERIRKLARPALKDIDDILQHHNGRRLADDVDAIGSVPVETTPAGIKALAQCSKVKVVLENQGVGLISPGPQT